MSYILDALRRADAERGLGHVPTLHTQTAFPTAGDDGLGVPPARWWRWGVVALVVSLLSVVAWWMLARTMPAPKALAVDAQPQVPISAEVTKPPPAPSPPLEPQPVVMTPAEVPSVVVAQTPAVIAPSVPPPTIPTTQPAASSTTPVAEAPNAAPHLPAKAPAVVSAAVDKTVPTLSELPESIRRELPTLSVGGAMHSNNPASRMLILNGQVFQEGDAVTADLVLEQINLKSAVLVYKGQRYSISY
ncbi:MAG: general secretion pathway protein GspB [Burkholderiales bacterium]